MTKTKKQSSNYTDHEQEPRTIDCIRARANSELVDITAGPMSLDQACNEIKNVALNYGKSPKYIVVLLEKSPGQNKYHTTVYITKEDFEAKK